MLLIIFSSNSETFVWAGDISKVSSILKDPIKIIDRGKGLFLKFCAHCHGRHGDGDGFNAEFLDKDPTELSNPKFQAKRSNEKLFRVISEGGAKIKKSHLMPGFGHTLSEEEIWSLVTFIRYLGKDGSLVTVPRDVKSERPMKPVLTKTDMGSFLKWFSEEGQKKNQANSGKILIMNKKSCLGCHQLNGEGGRIGPNLNRSAFNYNPEWIYAWISNPQAFRPDTRMPNLGLTPKEARAIAAFLVSFQPENEGDGGKFDIPEGWRKYLSIKGDPKIGGELFNDPDGTANCVKCHLIKGEGGTIGPELGIVGTSRTRRFLLESILDPSAVITSGYKTIMIMTKNGKFITGIKKNEDELGFYIVDKNGTKLYIPMDKIKKFKTQKTSTMPGNFRDLLEVQEVADLLAYLGTLTLPTITASIY